MGKICYGCMQMKTRSPVCEHCGYNENMGNLSHQLPCGTVLAGQYIIGKVLGQGGFGITYLGWDRNLEMPVAIKEYYPSGAVNREATQNRCVTLVQMGREENYRQNKERFLREARTLARLRNIPEIVHVYNFFEENNTAYIVMEYIQGMELRRFVQMRGGRLSARESLALLQPVMYALSKVHEVGLVHRDISPDNIMLLHGGEIKLLDFGAVREVPDADSRKELANSTEAILKHGFAPMEQYQKRGSLGPWTDVYALCATLYYCMTGEVPPDAPARMIEDVPLQWDRIPGLHDRQRQILEAGMTLRAKDRVASVSQLWQGLYQTGSAAPSQPVSDPVRPVNMGSQKPYPSMTLSLEEEPAHLPPVQLQPAPEAPVYTVPLSRTGNEKDFPGANAEEAGVQIPLSAASGPDADQSARKSKPTAAKKKATKLFLLLAAVVIVVGILGFFLVHVWEDPTCEQGSTCVICGMERSDALGHNFTEGTCQESGVCLNCGKQSDKRAGHTWSEPTCSKGSYCTVCGQGGVGPTAHDYIKATYDSPNICRVCGHENGTPLGWIGGVSGSYGNRFYRSGRRTSSYELEKKIINCYRFTLHYSITKVNSGNPYGNFEVFVRYGEEEWEWESIGMFTIEPGQKTVSIDFELPWGHSFDAIAVVCQAYGSYSYSHSIGITDVQQYVSGH